MVSAFLRESAFWGKDIDDHALAHAVAEDYIMLTETITKGEDVTQLLETPVNT
jgi:hypothetical protein